MVSELRRFRLLLYAFIVAGAAADAPAADRSIACNGNRFAGLEWRAKQQPDFERKCFAVAMDLLEEATGHDFHLLEAQGIFQTLLRAFPEGAYAPMGYVELEIRKRELQLPATDAYRLHEEARRATRIAPANPQAFLTLARTELLVGCAACAARSTQQAAALGASGTSLAFVQSIVAELGGDMRAARRHLDDVLATPSLRAESRTRVLLALSAFHLRQGNVEAAERAVADAVTASPRSMHAQLRQAEFLLNVRGDAPAATRAAERANAVVPTVLAKRLISIAEYLHWSQHYRAAGAGNRIKRIAQVGFVAPEEAFVIAARHAALSTICEALLESKVISNVDTRDGDGNTALIAAAMGANAPLARKLIARRANVNAQNGKSDRALSWFLRSGDHAAVKMLLKAGAEVSYTDTDGQSPLSIAAQRGDAKMVIELLQRDPRALLNPHSEAGELLRVAVLSENGATVKALLDAGVRIDASDRQGATALVTAVIVGNPAIAKLLLERGASSDAALEVARQLGNYPMMELLRSFTKRSI